MAFRDIQDPNLRRVIISSLLGATIEWYDFFLYGVVAGIVFNKLESDAVKPTPSARSSPRCRPSPLFIS